MKPASQTIAVLLALLLVTSAGAAAFGTTAASSAGSQSVGGPDVADEVYVAENGDAVLVYNETQEETAEVDLAGDFGFDVEAGLLHLFYEGDFANASGNETPEMTGDAAFEATPDSLSATADLVAERPEDLESLDVDVDHKQSRSEFSSQSSGSLTANASNLSQLYTSVDVETESTVTASTLESSGSVSFQQDEEMLFGQNDQLIDLEVTQDGDDYVLSVTEDRPVTQWEADRWNTREDAVQSLESRYVETAIGLGGSADVSLESYEYEGGNGTEAEFDWDAEDSGSDAENLSALLADTGEPGHLAVEYEVTFEGVSEGVSEMLTEELEAAQDLDLTEAEAQSIADGIAALEVEHLTFTTETTGGETTTEWDVSLAGFDEFTLAVFEVAEAVEELDDDLADQLDETRELLDAQAEANVVQTSSTAFEAEITDDDRLTVEFSSQSEAENWDAYVENVEERGLEEYVVLSSYSLDVETDGDELTTRFDGSVEQEDALDTFLENLLASAESDPTADEEFVEAIESFQNAEFQVAKADASVSETSFTVEAATQFDNLSSFETEDGLEVVGVHGETEGGVTTTYLSVAGFVGADASEDDARNTEYADENTEVHEPGEWDDEELPQTDVESVSEYLEEDDSLLPGSTAGIAIAVGVVALLAVVGAVTYRRVA